MSDLTIHMVSGQVSMGVHTKIGEKVYPVLTVKKYFMIIMSKMANFQCVIAWILKCWGTGLGWWGK